MTAEELLTPTLNDKLDTCSHCGNQDNLICEKIVYNTSYAFFLRLSRGTILNRKLIFTCKTCGQAITMSDATEISQNHYQDLTWKTINRTQTATA